MLDVNVNNFFLFVFTTRFDRFDYLTDRWYSNRCSHFQRRIIKTTLPDITNVHYLNKWERIVPKQKNDTLYMEHYIVAFVDVLGQQEKLRNLRKLPEGKNEEEEFYQIIRDTYGSVSQMQKSFTQFFSSFSNIEIDQSRLSSDQKEIIQHLKSNEIHFQRFSDCIIIYSSLRDDKNKVPGRSVFGMLAAIAASFLQCFASGIPIRAGIDVGLGMEVHEGEFYGPALSRAYTLESRVATYPRAIVGEELVNYLH
jgi:hypothetical protein